MKTCICKKCSKEFRAYNRRNQEAKYCSSYCYWNDRWGGEGKCRNCKKETKFRFCSPLCTRKYWNTHDYPIKSKRFWARKMNLIERLGGKCTKCGISDVRVLDINHIDRNKKRRPKDGYYTWHRRLQEWEENISNIELLCANCHRMHTWEQMGYGKSK